jgi:hypothetical protein
MTDGPSKYAGLAAAAVFLVGWFIVGNAAIRVTVLGVVAFIVALAAAQTASRRAVVGAIAAAICSALVAYKAHTCQLSGTAPYFTGQGRWGLHTKLVTRDTSPSEFRQAIKTIWTGSALLASVSAGCLLLQGTFRRVEDCYDSNL